MRRRYIALIAIAVPVALMAILKQIHPVSYEWLMGYMVAVALVFKGSILSLWFASKLKLISFLKGLTLFQGFSLLIKRWFLDNVLATWIKEHIIDHVKEGFKEVKDYYLRLNLKAKLKNIFIIVFGTVITAWLLHFIGYLEHLLLFAEIKLIITGALKAILGFFGKFGSWLITWFSTSWLAPILEVFALSYLLTLIEKWFGPQNPVSRFFNYIGDKLNVLLYHVGILKQKHIDPVVECNIVSNSKKFGDSLSRMIRAKKIDEEYRYFERFENIIMKGHIDAYHSFKDMDKVTDKKELYRLINQKTRDNIDIVAYASRNALGILLEESVPDSFYHDIFLLESFASHREHGVKVYEEDPKHIDHTDFWALNTSAFCVIIGSESNNFPPECILAHELKLIKTARPFSYEDGDVYCEYEGVKVAVTPVERG